LQERELVRNVEPVLPASFATVPQSTPNRRAISRWFSLSHNMAMQTFKCSSTPYILPPPDCSTIRRLAFGRILGRCVQRTSDASLADYCRTHFTGTGQKGI
jgi:hypothetical protein